MQKVGVELNLSNLEIILGRSFLQCPINTDGTVDTPHIDIDDNESFIVALYYVCDSDGDTIIYNERKEQPEGQYTIKQKVTPKKVESLYLMVVFTIQQNNQYLKILDVLLIIAYKYKVQTYLDKITNPLQAILRGVK